MPFFWETQTHHLHSGFSSKGFPQALQDLFIVLISPGKISNADKMVYVSKNGECVIETSVDGALLQAEQSVRPGRPEVSDVSKAPNSPSVSSPTVPSKTQCFGFVLEHATLPKFIVELFGVVWPNLFLPI